MYTGQTFAATVASSEEMRRLQPAEWRVHVHAARRRALLKVWASVRLMTAYKHKRRMARVHSFSFFCAAALGPDLPRFVAESDKHCQLVALRERIDSGDDGSATAADRLLLLQSAERRGMLAEIRDAQLSISSRGDAGAAAAEPTEQAEQATQQQPFPAETVSTCDKHPTSPLAVLPPYHDAASAFSSGVTSPEPVTAMPRQPLPMVPRPPPLALMSVSASPQRRMTSSGAATVRERPPPPALTSASASPPRRMTSSGAATARGPPPPGPLASERSEPRLAAEPSDGQMYFASSSARLGPFPRMSEPGSVQQPHSE
eukprot:355483-Chlamydomonas_euryale.AAC.2